jgi:G3E family GTPase
MKIALNMLIATTKPDRILIEPTGLGHPAEIIQTLTGEYYDEVLDLRATLTLVDPRKLSDSRYSENANFHDQLAVADVVVANKMDLVEAVDERSFELLLQSFQPPKLANYRVTQGQLNTEWLNMARNPDLVENKHRYRGHLLKPQRELLDAGIHLPEGENFIRRENSGQNFYSCGWLFRPDWVFDFNLLFLLMTGLMVMRAKAVMRTDQGAYVFNSENGVLSVNQLERVTAEAITDSRIELIDDNPIANDAFEQQLMLLIKH